MRELDAEGNEPLLRAVVEVTLDARTLVVSGFGDAAARALEVAHRMFEIHDQPLVTLNGENDAGDSVQELLVVTQHAVV